MIINEQGLIVGLYYSDETTSRKECLQISIKKGDKKLSTCLSLRNEDFHLQYMKACVIIANFFDNEGVSNLIETKDNFIKNYNLTIKPITINIVVKK